MNHAQSQGIAGRRSPRQRMLETVERQGSSITRGSAPDPGVFKASRRLNDGPLKRKATGVFGGHTRPQSPDLRAKPPEKRDYSNVTGRLGLGPRN